MSTDLDYQRFGRQIALPDLGAAGQHRLADTPVRFEGTADVASLAARLHARAGGALTPQGRSDPSAGPSVTVAYAPRTDAGRLALAAFYAVEAARAVLGRPPVGVPVALLERLGVEPGSP